MDLSNFLLPSSELEIKEIQNVAGLLSIKIACVKNQVQCPLCHSWATRIHSRYTRTLADLPCVGLSLQLRLLVRRFRCEQPTYQRQLFCERFDPHIAAYARRTARLNQALTTIAFAVSGESGKRLSTNLQMSVSGRTLRRLINQHPVDEVEKVRVVGIDDWAWKKGCNYGTILVDLERHQPIELLADRSVSSASQWFKDHPSVEIISRDRGKTYIEAATTGAPQAQQVADRWHLLHNLAQTLEHFFHNKNQLLKTAALVQSPKLSTSASASSQKEISQTPLPMPAARTNAADLSKSQQAASQARVKRRQELYSNIHKLHDMHQNVATIARQLKISRLSVYAYLRLKEPPQPTHIQYSRAHLIDSYKPYLLQRWNEGCRNAKQLWRELIEQGYTYSLSTVERFVNQRFCQKSNHVQVNGTNRVQQARLLPQVKLL